MGGGGFLHRARQIAPHAAILITAPLGPFLYHEGAFYDFSGPRLKQDINIILLSITREMSIAHDPKKNKVQQRKANRLWRKVRKYGATAKHRARVDLTAMAFVGR